MPSYYSLGAYSAGLYSAVGLHNLAGAVAPSTALSGNLSIVGKAALSWRASFRPSVTLSGVLNRIAQIAGDLSPSTTFVASGGLVGLDLDGGDCPANHALGASLTAARPFGGRLPTEIILVAELTSGPLWEPVEPCESVDWEESALCNG